MSHDKSTTVFQALLVLLCAILSTFTVVLRYVYAAIDERLQVGEVGDGLHFDDNVGGDMIGPGADFRTARHLNSGPHARQALGFGPPVKDESGPSTSSAGPSSSGGPAGPSSSGGPSKVDSAAPEAGPAGPGTRLTNRKGKWYAVVRGYVPGIYRTWGEAAAQVNGFPSNVYKAFNTREEAIQFYKEGLRAFGMGP